MILMLVDANWPVPAISQERGHPQAACASALATAGTGTRVQTDWRSNPMMDVFPLDPIVKQEYAFSRRGARSELLYSNEGMQKGDNYGQAVFSLH